MDKGQRETFKIRVISASFTLLALAVFKPFGLDAWHWEVYAHLLVIWAMGVVMCVITDSILKYIVKMPRSYENGVSYIIRRNLWFQVINTLLVTFMICLYRHFVLNKSVEGNQLSWTNFLETLLIIGFCSYAIGLYWRFKFRSRFLAAELEETRLLNEQLQKLQREEEESNRQTVPTAEATDSEMKSPTDAELSSTVAPQEKATVVPPSILTLTGTTSDTITLPIAQLLYIEAVGNYVKICQLREGKVRTDMLRSTSKQMEDRLQAYPMIVRCHRAFLVNLQQVEKISSKAGSMQLLIKHCHETLPVSRSNMAQVKSAIKSM